MAFEDLLDHRCDIYHMVKGGKGYGVCNQADRFLISEGSGR